MSTATTPPGDPATGQVAPRRSDRSPWHWLLLVPIVVTLLVPLYNHVDPKLGSFPLFYWLQLAFIALGVATTTVVYQMTKRPSDRAPRTQSTEDGVS